jgi:hypothetical protein
MNYELPPGCLRGPGTIFRLNAELAAPPASIDT